MKTIICILLLGSAVCINSQPRTIHVFVSLCDNEYQGIVPVPRKLGNGKDPANNLYWGAGFGVKTYFLQKPNGWKLVSSIKPDDPAVLERLLFKHVSHKAYLLADAYDGELIQTCIENFLKASNGQKPEKIQSDSLTLTFGGAADLLAYVGHDGLMDFGVNMEYQPINKITIPVMILACYSKMFFSAEVKKAGALPLLWTTHLMAPEAYILKEAVDGWLLHESGAQIEERAAQTYNKFQKCGIRGARNLFTTGF